MARFIGRRPDLIGDKVSLLLFLKAALLGLGSGVGKAEESADDGGGDAVGDSAEQALSKELLQRLGVDDDVQHGSHQTPADYVGDDLGQVEAQDLLLAEDALGELDLLCGKADQQTENAGGDDPAPPHTPAVAEVDESVADEADEGAGNRSEQDCHEGQKAVLGGDIGVGDGAGDCDEAAQNEEQGGADADGNDGGYGRLFHFLTPFLSFLPMFLDYCLYKYGFALT